MNQFAPMSSFRVAQESVSWPLSSETTAFSRQLRELAAQFKMHYAAVHRLGPANALLKDATHVASLRGLDSSAFTIGDLMDRPTLERLLCGNAAISWQIEVRNPALSQDPIGRLGIKFGVSVPFHNALGNHVALSLFDKTEPSLNKTELSQQAWPLIDAILAAERATNKNVQPLSIRETECLRWAAAGKTSIETSMITGLSPYTVNQYLTAAAAKLEAVNRTHAVTKAIRLGLIDLSAV